MSVKDATCKEIVENAFQYFNNNHISLDHIYFHILWQSINDDTLYSKPLFNYTNKPYWNPDAK